MQIYLLTVLYLLFTGLFLLIDNYREYLAFLIRYRHLLLASVRARAVSGALGMILSVLNLFFPSYPGPMYIGDLLPAIALFLSAFYYFTLKEERISNATLYARGKTRGILLILAALFHFLIPSCVIL